MVLRSIALAVVSAVLMVLPAGSPAQERSAEVDQYLEVVPDARGGRVAGRESVSIEELAPVTDSAHCREDARPSAAASAAGFLGDRDPPAGGVGPLLPLALLVAGAALGAAALSRRRATLIAGAVMLGLLLPAVAGAQVDFGVFAAREGSSTLSASELARMRLGGAKDLRTTLDWELVEPQEGAAYDFRNFDKILTWASEGDLPMVRVLPILFGSPSWIEGIETSNEPPRTRSELVAWGRFVEAAVDRYGPDGLFWRERATSIAAGRLRYNPIRDWQVWNEPNLSPFWTNARPDAKQYAELLRVTDEAIKRKDPGARTVLAGMLERRDAPLPMSKFLDQLYQVKGISGHFDVLAPQPFVFVDDSRSLTSSLRRVRRIANDHDDDDKPIFITEVGVASAGPKTELTTDEQGQAATLREYFSSIAELAGPDGIEKAMWFQWRDADVFPPTDPENERWQTYAGLFSAEGRAKPAWQAFCAINRGSPGSGRLRSHAAAF